MGRSTFHDRYLLIAVTISTQDEAFEIGVSLVPAHGPLTTLHKARAESGSEEI